MTGTAANCTGTSCVWGEDGASCISSVASVTGTESPTRCLPLARNWQAAPHDARACHVPEQANGKNDHGGPTTVPRANAVDCHDDHHEERDEYRSSVRCHCSDMATIRGPESDKAKCDRNRKAARETKNTRVIIKRCHQKAAERTTGQETPVRTHLLGWLIIIMA